MDRYVELASIVGAGAAGAAVAVFAVGGSLTVIVLSASVVGVVTLAASGSWQRRRS